MLPNKLFMFSTGSIILLAIATFSAHSFTIETEFPATASSPTTHTYVTFLVASPPLGSTYFRIVIDDPGPAGAVGLPIDWAPAHSNARLMVAPLNYTLGRNDVASRGAFVVHAEAWTDRADLPGTQGRLLGQTQSLTVYFDFSFCNVSLECFDVTSTGPGEADIRLVASGDAAERLLSEGTRLGLFFFARYFPTGDTGQEGAPLFSDAQEQYQYASPVFRVAWTQPGVYYVGLNGAWSGATYHNVLWSPFDGVATPVFPQVPQAGFQPLALVVPYANGTRPPLAPGFRGQVEILPPIPGDRRVALSKNRITVFNGCHWYVPATMPYISPPLGASLVALDIDVPLGITVYNGSGAVRVLPAPENRSRFRIILSDPSPYIGVGVLVDARVVPGDTNTVGFRAIATNNSAVASETFWLVVNLTIVAPPRLPLPKRMSTGISFGSEMDTWPHDSSVSPITTYRGLGLNLVPAVSTMPWLSKSARLGPEWDGLGYAPATCVYQRTQNLLTWSVSQVLAANISSLCGPLGVNETAERLVWLAAAQFYELFGFVDLAYNGCLRAFDLNVTALAQVASSLPETIVYDVESWPDYSEWVLHAANSSNALARRKDGEAISDLAYRLSTDWFDDLVMQTKALSPNTTSAMWGGTAGDNKGCCSGSKLGSYDWRILERYETWSFPEYYNTAKNLRLLTSLVHRERRLLPPSTSAGPGYMLLPSITPQGALAFGGGTLRSEVMFDVLVQLLASGATGMSLFEDPCVDDAGVYLAMGEALSLAVPFEDDILFGGSLVADSDIEVTDNAIINALRSRDGHTLFIAVTPDSAYLHHGCDPPAPAQVHFSVKSPTDAAPGMPNYVLVCHGGSCAGKNQAGAATVGVAVSAPCQPGAWCQATESGMTRSSVYLLVPFASVDASLNGSVLLDGALEASRIYESK